MGNDNEKKADKKRRSGWSKGVDLLLRLGHIGVASVLFGGVVWGVPFDRLWPWHQLVIASGGTLIIAEFSQSRHWPYQLRGVMAALHIGLLSLVHLRPELLRPVLIAVLAYGVVGSNMPGYLRHWSLLHGRRVD